MCEVPTGNPVHEFRVEFYSDFFLTGLKKSQPHKKPEDEDYKCEENFHYFEGNGFCYHTSKTPHGWKGAGRYCSNLGAQLASVHDADENAFIGRCS